MSDDSFTPGVEILFFPGNELRSFRVKDLREQLVSLLSQSPYSPVAASLERFFDACLTSVNVSGEQKLLAIALTDKRYLCGFAQFRCYDTNSDLDFIIVDLQHRGRGLAKLIMNKSFSQLKERGVDRMVLEVSSLNTSALAFYRGIGFTQLALRPKYYRNGEDAIIMEKSF